MTLKEWIKKYEEKSGEKHVNPAGFETLYDKDKGYAQIKKDGKFLIVYEVCGDGKYWRDRAEKAALEKDCSWLFTICVRNILPYIRLMESKLLEKTTLPNFHNAIKGCGINHLGNKLIIMPAWYDEDKKQLAYNVYSEVRKDNDY